MIGATVIARPNVNLFISTAKQVDPTMPKTSRRPTGSVPTDVYSNLTVSRPELLAGGSDFAFREFLHNTLAFASRVHEVRNHLAQAIGLTGTAFSILISIRHLETRQPSGVNQLAEHLHFSGAFVTIEVNKLVKAGLVAKRTNPADRRRVQLTVTPEGMHLIRSVNPIQRPVNDVLFGDLTAEEFTTLKGLMARLVITGDSALSLLNYLTQSGGLNAAPAAPDEQPRSI